METVTMKIRGRKVNHEEALKAAHRLVNSHFRNPDSARCSIPVQADDDDVTVIDYIQEQKEQAELYAVALDLTDTNAVSFLECNSMPVRDGDVEWWDLGDDPDDLEDCEQELRYLELRGLLERHPGHANWIRVKEAIESV